MEKKLLETGEKNPKYIDLLEEDNAVHNQKWCCVSFISPEKYIKRKDEFYFTEFVKYYDLDKSINKYQRFLNFLSYKYDLEFDNLMQDFSQFLVEEKDKVYETNISEEYKTFLDKNEDRLEGVYNKENNFQTNTRGLKIRGSYDTYDDAEKRAKYLRDVDSAHDIYIGEVGKWMPFNPDAYKTGKVEYLEDELNTIMDMKSRKDDANDYKFKKRIQDAKQTAVLENKKKSKITGNKLTQDVSNESDDEIHDDNVESINIVNEVFENTLDFVKN
jgi:hypothetical protein